MAARFDHQRLNEDRWQDLSDSDKVASFQLLVIDYIRYLQQDPPESSKELQAVAAFVRLITPKTAWELAVDVVPALASAEQDDGLTSMLSKVFESTVPRRRDTKPIAFANPTEAARWQEKLLWRKFLSEVEYLKSVWATHLGGVPEGREEEVHDLIDFTRKFMLSPDNMDDE